VASTFVAMLTALGLLANVEHGDWVTVAENGGK
jgi:hypothetical protein